MTDMTDGGPVYPGTIYTQSGYVSGHSMGMSLRDWFAGQALAGYFAAPHTPHQNAASADVAEYLYEIADAMLAARQGGKP